MYRDNIYKCITHTILKDTQEYKLCEFETEDKLYFQVLIAKIGFKIYSLHSIDGFEFVIQDKSLYIKKRNSNRIRFSVDSAIVPSTKILQGTILHDVVTKSRLIVPHLIEAFFAGEKLIYTPSEKEFLEYFNDTPNCDNAVVIKAFEQNKKLRRKVNQVAPKQSGNNNGKTKK